MSKIDETLKKIAAGTSKANSQTSSNTEKDEVSRDLPGDPNCPICGGVGYLRLDVPVGHPDFGKVEVCSCRQSQVSRQVRQRLYALSNLDELKHLSFENFLPRGRVGLLPMQADSLELAYQHSQLFAQNLNGWLLIQGGYGSGKTHLAAAIANYSVSLGVPTLFITIPDLLDTLRYAYDDPAVTFEERFEEIRKARLLVMDDFGTQNATAWAQEKLFQILNYRYINHLPLVITTNLSLGEIEDRISSRLQDPELVTRVMIQATDYRRPLEDTGHPELSSLTLPMLQNCTFVNFDLRQGEGLSKEEAKSLEAAFKAARKFAEKPRGWLVFTGSSGCGKTHLAAAIGNYRTDLGQPPVFMLFSDLFDHLRATFSPSSQVSYDKRFDEMRTAHLLILDDLWTQDMKPWVREKLLQLLSYRYNAELPTVITSLERLEEIDPRLRTRLADTRVCDVYAITAPMYRISAKPSAKGTTRRPRARR